MSSQTLTPHPVVSPFAAGTADRILAGLKRKAPPRILVRPARAAAEEFLHKSRKRALDLAWRITRDHDLAEEAWSITAVEYLEGKTWGVFFFNAIRMNARNLLARRATERKRMASLGMVRTADGTRGSEQDEDALPVYEPQDFPSGRHDDQDPLEILIARDDKAEYDAQVRAALRDPRWRYIKLRLWAKPLLECADLTP